MNREKSRMEKRHVGNLTAADQARLSHQQNSLSRQIYRDKHNGLVQNTNPKTEVGQRQRNQQERIAQGIKSGQLAAGETAHLERHEAAVNHEIRTGGEKHTSITVKIETQQRSTPRSTPHANNKSPQLFFSPGTGAFLVRPRTLGQELDSRR